MFLFCRPEHDKQFPPLPFPECFAFSPGGKISLPRLPFFSGRSVDTVTLILLFIHWSRAGCSLTQILGFPGHTLLLGFLGT